MAAAIREFLRAAGVDELDARLRATPERVSRLWADDLLDGYRRTPAEALGRLLPTNACDLVAVTNIDVHSICPHHLLPYEIVAHVAFVPNGKTAGFSRLAALVEVFAHRLILLEDLAAVIADALVTELGARGAACLLDSKQGCMVYRHEKRGRSRAHAAAYRGILREQGRLQREFLRAVAAGRNLG
jgi:GTP cyclohydrolase I